MKAITCEVDTSVLCGDVAGWPDSGGVATSRAALVWAGTGLCRAIMHQTPLCPEDADMLMIDELFSSTHWLCTIGKRLHSLFKHWPLGTMKGRAANFKVVAFLRCHDTLR